MAGCIFKLCGFFPICAAQNVEVGCLTGEAAETVKGLGYSEAAYERANARLLRKYGGTRRQVQGNLEELKKMNTLREDYAKALEKFADVLERVVINLKENDRQSDLKDGTLYTIILEKIPESAKSFVSTSGGVEPKIQRCKLCGHSHPIWQCDEFKGRPVERR